MRAIIVLALAATACGGGGFTGDPAMLDTESDGGSAEGALADIGRPSTKGSPEAGHEAAADVVTAPETGLIEASAPEASAPACGAGISQPEMCSNICPPSGSCYQQCTPTTDLDCAYIASTACGTSTCPGVGVTCLTGGLPVAWPDTVPEAPLILLAGAVAYAISGQIVLTCVPSGSPCVRDSALDSECTWPQLAYSCPGAHGTNPPSASAILLTDAVHPANNYCD